MIAIEVTTRVTGINHNYNVISFSYQYITINTSFIKVLLKAILKVAYNVYTGADTTFDKDWIKHLD